MSETRKACKYTVEAPVKDFTGQVGSVSFIDGEAEVDTATQLSEYTYLRSAGYKLGLIGEHEVDAGDVDAGAQAGQQSAAPPDVAEQPKPYSGKPEWVAWSVKQGADPAEAEAATKQELIDKYGTTK